MPEWIISLSLFLYVYLYVIFYVIILYIFLLSLFCYRVLHLALSYIEYEVTLRRFRCETSKVSLKQILASFHGLWLEYFEEKRRKEEEEDSLYKFKTKSHCVDSCEPEKNEKSFRNFFPSFDEDYRDVVPRDTLNDSITDAIEQSHDSSTSSVDETSTLEMAYIDACRIFNSLKVIMNDESQLNDSTVMDVFLNGYKEFCSLSSLDVIKKGEFP